MCFCFTIFVVSSQSFCCITLSVLDIFLHKKIACFLSVTDQRKPDTNDTPLIPQKTNKAKQNKRKISALTIVLLGNIAMALTL